MTKRAIGSHPYLFAMPMVLVGTEVKGKANFMPAAFVGIMNFNPAVIAMGLNKHYTVQGILTNKTFSVNVPSAEMLVVMDYCGLVTGAKTDKSKIFKTFKGKLAGAPIIEDCPVTMECRLVNQVSFKVDTAYFGEIAEIYAEEHVLTNNDPDPAKINPILFTFPDKGLWRLGERIGEGWSSGKAYRPKKD